MKRSKFYRSQPRAVTTVECECHAAAELFLRWEELSPAARKEFQDQGPIPCEGGGLPGEWCARCRFGVVKEPLEAGA